MGTNFKDIVIKREITFDALRGKRFVVDGFNILYQFLATIRQPDGSLLTDSHGNITSHLTGLFNRTARLMENGLSLAFVFDGEVPALKKRERQRRKELKEEAEAKYKEAEAKEDVDGMKKYASRTTRLTPQMLDDAKALISAMGLPIVQATGEGEAQAAHIVKKGDAYASISQDYDSLMFGVPRMVQNLTISARKKTASKLSYETVTPQMIELSENLRALGINLDQLIAMGMLIGTDYNHGGIKGIGPKHALALVKKHNDAGTIFKEAKWDEHFDFSWEEVFDAIKNAPVTDDYSLEWNPVDDVKVIEVLCDRHDFNLGRVESVIERLKANTETRKQKSLLDF